MLKQSDESQWISLGYFVTKTLLAQSSIDVSRLNWSSRKCYMQYNTKNCAGC